jgi:hypothetical protein
VTAMTAAGMRGTVIPKRPKALRYILPSMDDPLGAEAQRLGIVGCNRLVTSDAYGTGLNKVMGLTANSINNHGQSHMNRRIILVMTGWRQWQRNPKPRWIISATSSK